MRTKCKFIFIKFKLTNADVFGDQLSFNQNPRPNIVYADDTFHRWITNTIPLAFLISTLTHTKPQTPNEFYRIRIIFFCFEMHRKKIIANWFITFLANALKINLRWNRWESSGQRPTKSLFVYSLFHQFIHLSNPRTHSWLSDELRE